MIQLFKSAFVALQPLSNIGIHRERENITQSQVDFAREVVRDISVALDSRRGKKMNLEIESYEGELRELRKAVQDDRTCKILPFHNVGSNNPDLVGFKGGTMISDYNDPAGPMTDIDKNILELRKLLRVSSGPDLNQIIACCQSIRRDLSSIEDWAFQKGKEHV
jgi:hypothetical protein